MLLLDERIAPDGTHARTYADRAGDRIAISDDHDGTSGELSLAAIDKVMTRYGRALEADVVLDGEALELAGGHRLRRLRYHAVVDATGRDYLVWERPDHEPLAVIATTVTAALRYLVVRLAADRAARPQETEPGS